VKSWEHIFRLHYIRVVYSKVMIVNIYFITSNYVVCCIKVCCIQVLLYSNTYVKACSSLLFKKFLCNCGIRDEESNQ